MGKKKRNRNISIPVTTSIPPDTGGAAILSTEHITQAVINQPILTGT